MVYCLTFYLCGLRIQTLVSAHFLVVWSSTEYFIPYRKIGGGGVTALASEELGEVYLCEWIVSLRDCTGLQTIKALTKQ